MKKYLTILFLLITSVAFSQQKYVVKVQGAVTTSDVSKIVKDSIDSIQATVIKVARPLRVRDSDTTLIFQNDSIPAQLTYTESDTSSIGSDDKNIPSVGWVNGRIGGLSSKNIDTVSTTSELVSYDKSSEIIYVTDTLQEGLFYWVSSVETVDNGIVFSATGKGSGYWVRVYDKSKGVSVDWWGARNSASINKAIAFAGGGGVINFTGGKTYQSEVSIVPLSLQTLNGNGAILKRLADSVVTLTASALVTDSSIIVTAVPSTWIPGKGIQIFTDSTTYGSSQVLTIANISGDTVTFTTSLGSNVNTNVDHPALTSWPLGTKARYIYSMIGSLYPLYDSYKLYNLNFDGNKDFCKANYYWAVNQTIVSSGYDGQLLIKDCHFYNIPNENIMGHGFHVVDNFATQLNGSFIHLSADYSRSPQPIPSIIQGNVTDTTNINASSGVSVHSEAVVTLSNTPGYVTIANNRFKNGSESVFGYIASSTSASNGAFRNVLIEGNYAQNFKQIFYNIAPTMPATYKAGHIFIHGNTFDNCGINDFASQRLAIDTSMDTLMIGSNLLVGGTKWSIPVQKSDSLQRYILNNSSSTPQGGDIRITGNITARNLNLSSSLTNAGGNVLTFSAGGIVQQRTLSQLATDMSVPKSTGGSTNHYVKWSDAANVTYGTFYELGANMYNGSGFSIQGSNVLADGAFRAYSTFTGMYFGDGDSSITLKIPVYGDILKISKLGVVTVPTTSSSDSSNAIATTRFVKTYVKTGTATLASGTVTVSTSSVLSTSKIFVSYNTPSGTQGFLSAPTGSIIAGTSFVINSSSSSDNSTVNWAIY